MSSVSFLLDVKSGSEAKLHTPHRPSLRTTPTKIAFLPREMGQAQNIIGKKQLRDLTSQKLPLAFADSIGSGGLLI